MSETLQLDVTAELAALGLELQVLGGRVLGALADCTPDVLTDAVARREEILERIRELARQYPREVSTSRALAEAARQEAEVAAAANQRLDEIREELDNVAHRIALRQAYCLMPDEE